VISTEDTAIDDVVVDDNYVFRGFLAWCLWGWIPIQTGAKIKSSLFTDGKANALYGRKTMLRQALKSAKHAHAAKMPVVPAAKKTLTITIPDTKHKEQTAHRESTSMLKWALELFKTDLAEKELQKRSYL
jgi:phage tail protein X